MNTPFPIRDPTAKKELLKELYRLKELRDELEAKNRGAQATVVLFPSHPNSLKADMTETTLRMIDGFIAAIESELAAFEAPAPRPATGPGTVIPLGAPASSGLTPVVATAPAFAPPYSPGPASAGPVPSSGPIPAPGPIPRSSGKKRSRLEMFARTWATLPHPSVRGTLLAFGAIVAIVFGLVLYNGNLNTPTLDTSQVPTSITGTPGDGSGGMANGGVIIDLDTCTVKNEDGSTSPIENCTPATDALPSRAPASPNADLVIVDQPGECGVIHDYALKDLPRVSTSGNFIQVEHYDMDVASDPEVESVLPHGNYNVVGNLDGWVWEYSVECNLDEVLAFADAQIKGRQGAGENNAGLASQEVTDARFTLIDNQADFWGHFVADRSNPDAPQCQLMREYRLGGREQLSTKGAWIHVEHYQGGEPERESILNGDTNWKVQAGTDGFVWEYSQACNWNDVRKEIGDAKHGHIKRRLADHANNAGWIAFDNPAIKGRFTPIQ